MPRPQARPAPVGQHLDEAVEEREGGHAAELPLEAVEDEALDAHQVGGRAPALADADEVRGGWRALLAHLRRDQEAACRDAWHVVRVHLAAARRTDDANIRKNSYGIN